MCVCVRVCVALNRAEVNLNGVSSVCLSAPSSLFMAQSCGTNLLIEFKSGNDVARGDLCVCVCVCVCVRICITALLTFGC